MTFGVFSFCFTVIVTIFTGRTQKVDITSTPADARVVIYDRSGKIVYETYTPDTVTLDRGFASFKPASYIVELSLDNSLSKTQVYLKPKVNYFCYSNIFIATWALCMAIHDDKIISPNSMLGLIPTLLLIPFYVGSFWRLTPKKIHVNLSD